MITFGICLIYYGIALILYQMHGWLTAGNWTPFPVRRAWEGFFGSPSLSTPVLDALIEWLLAWPLSLALLTSGGCVLGLVFAFKRTMQWRRDHMRRNWVMKQCGIAGYKPWAMPKIMQDLDDRMRAEKVSQGKESG